jgi:hypothetical protein
VSVGVRVVAGSGDGTVGGKTYRVGNGDDESRDCIDVEGAIAESSPCGRDDG